MAKKQKKISGYIVRTRRSETVFGPFNTADAGVKWADANLSDPMDWYVQPLKNPLF